MKANKKIAVIGLGRIGLPSALNISRHGYDVYGIDRDQELLENLRHAKIPFIEEGLKEALQTTKMSFHDSLDEINSEIKVEWVLIAIPTLNADAFFDVESLRVLFESLPRDTKIIIESTLPIGGFEKLKQVKSSNSSNLIYCPERVAPGVVFDELQRVERCIASDNAMLLEAAVKFYSTISIQVRATSPSTAEFVKLSENAFRDANIAFSNQLSELCSRADVNVREVIEIANTHPRVHILNPGLGAGGACLSPSSKSLSATGFLKTVREINTRQIDRVVEKVVEHGFTRMAIWGMSYKPDCDDIRHSRVLALKVRLEEQNIDLRIWDPVANIGDMETSLEAREGIIFGVAHSVFHTLLPESILENSPPLTIFDFVGAIDTREWKKFGFSCICG